MNAKKIVAKKTVAKKSAAAGAGGTRKPAARRASSRTDPAGNVKTVNDLMAYAYALEAEASERYSEFADAMEAHNNREVAELFRKLARIEHRHAEQILEHMNWVSPPAPPSGGYRWEGLEGPESGDAIDLHYLMQPYHALQIALHNEKRAEVFFANLTRKATTAAVRKAAKEMTEEESEHVRLIQEWIKRTPVPETNWSLDPDPPVLSD